MSRKRKRGSSRKSEIKSVLRAPLVSEEPVLKDSASEGSDPGPSPEGFESDTEPSLPLETEPPPETPGADKPLAAAPNSEDEPSSEDSSNTEAAPDPETRVPLVSDVAPRANPSPPSAEELLEPEDLEDTESFLKGLVESLLFASPQPLAVKDIARLAGIDRVRVKELLELLTVDYASRGVNIEEIATGYVMRSAPKYGRHVQKLLGARPIRLSRAQLETLAIVAYRQPVTKPEVDDIRGVDSGQVIKGLLERGLLKILGKKDEPGRPMLYGTTTDFLELLNLQSLKELPTLREYSELSDESRKKFIEETGDEAPPEAAAQADDESSSDDSNEEDESASQTDDKPPAQASGEAETETDEETASGPAEQGSEDESKD